MHRWDKSITINLLFYLFSTAFPSNIFMFLSCRPFLLIQHFQQVLRVLKFLLSPGLGSWQLEFKSLIIVILVFKILFVAWPWLLILEIKSLMRGTLKSKHSPLSQAGTITAQRLFWARKSLNIPPEVWRNLHDVLRPTNPEIQLHRPCNPDF